MAAPEALTSGSFFFADIQRNQVDAKGLALLQALAHQGERAIIDRAGLTHQAQHSTGGGLDQTLTHLLQRELVEAVDGGYRFQVELIRRWFAQS
jgi:hypothetical protein